MNNTLLSLTIGIPAYNEVGNIKNLLEELLQQTENGFSLKEILVVSDGSTDGTVRKVREIRDKRIRIIEQQVRKGKSAAIDIILKSFDSDVILLIDADTHIQSKNTLKNFITHADFSGKNLVAPNFIPLQGKSILEKALYYSVLMQNEVKEKWNSGKNYLAVKGCFLGLSRKFAKSFTIPQGITNDDAYLYFQAREQGVEPQYVPQAVVNYKLPSLLKEH